MPNMSVATSDANPTTVPAIVAVSEDFWRRFVLVGDIVGDVGNVGDVYDVENCVIVPAGVALEVEANSVDKESVAKNTLDEDEALSIGDSKSKH
jgi:hypothetical protein